MPGQDRLDLGTEGTGKEAEAVVLSDDLGRGIGDTAGEVEDLIDDRTHARPGQDDAHFAGDSQQLVANDLSREGVRARLPLRWLRDQSDSPVALPQ